MTSYPSSLARSLIHGEDALATLPKAEKNHLYVGIMASDPLRSIGLQSILEDSLPVRAVILPDETRPRGQKLHALIMDQGLATDPIPTAVLHRALMNMPGVAVVLMAPTETLPELDRVLAAGARAILPDTAEVAEIRACVRAVLRGKTWSPAEREPATLDGDAAPLPLSQRFTPKEREVMQWLSLGHSNREIARTMGIDEATVKAHLGRMLRKAEATNRVELTLRSLAEQRSRP